MKQKQNPAFNNSQQDFQASRNFNGSFKQSSPKAKEAIEKAIEASKNCKRKR